MDDRDASESPRMDQFVTLLATCQRPVFLYALSLAHNPADAEEILQETNLVLWRKFNEYRPGTDFVRWACRIAYFEVLKAREKQAKAEKYFSNEFIETLAVEAENVIDCSDARRQALARCMNKLKEQDRQLVARRYQPGATTRSVAEAFGRSVQGTRKALHRIRMALLGCVERQLAWEDRT